MSGWVLGVVTSTSDLSQASNYTSYYSQEHPQFGAGNSAVDPESSHADYLTLTESVYDAEFPHPYFLTFPEYISVAYNFDLSCLTAVEYNGNTEDDYGTDEDSYVKFTIQGLYQKQSTNVSRGWVNILPYYKQIKFRNRNGTLTNVDGHPTQQAMVLVYDAASNVGGWCFENLASAGGQTVFETPNWTDTGGNARWQARNVADGVSSSTTSYGSAIYPNMNFIQESDDRIPTIGPNLTWKSWNNGGIDNMFKLTESNALGNTGNEHWDNSGGSNTSCE